MLLAIVVLLNGAFVPSSPPVYRARGHIMAPLAPVVTQVADHVSTDERTVTLVRGDRTCSFTLGLLPYRCNATIRLADAAPVVRDGVVFVPLATVVRAFGGSATYDARHRSVSLALPEERSVITPAPFDPDAPQAAPTQIFTPQPAPATPQAVMSGDPRPRRTAIPATPSRIPE
jgi:hypothetical protein